jgi:Cupin-like domain
MFNVFENATSFEQQDRTPFQFRHKLADDPALSLEHLTNIIPELPPELLFCSDRRMVLGENFDAAISAGRKKYSKTIDKFIATLPTSDAYLMVKAPETHPALRPLFENLTADVEHTINARGLGERALNCTSYLFMSSPHSVTPFHFDRYSNFLLQIRGTKEVTVFKPWDSEVVTQEEQEAHIAYEGDAIRWRPAHASRGQAFHCTPGDALHMPFISPHHVKNGSELSITLSIFFNDTRTRQQVAASQFNHHMRRSLGALSWKPTPVGQHHTLDSIKGFAYRGLAKAGSVLRIR